MFTGSDESPDAPYVFSESKDAGSNNRLRHDFGNELAVIQGFTWLALTSLRQLGAKLEGDAQTDLQSIISMVERIKISADQGRKLLGIPAEPVAPAAAEPPRAAQCRVLAVDDSRPLLTLLNKILSGAGYEVEAFTDPVGALRRFAETPDAFDIVVTDDLMPNMSGAMLAGEIHAIRATIPIVRCTGADASASSSGNDWAQASIRKPYRPRQLIALLENAIAGTTKAAPHTSVACNLAPNSCDDRANAQ